MFYEKFCELCKQKGVSRGAACEAVGLSANAWRRWSGGSTPNGKSVRAIADFFGVDSKEMLGLAMPEDASVAARREALERPEMKILFDAAINAPSDAILEAALGLMKRKETNPD